MAAFRVSVEEHVFSVRYGIFNVVTGIFDLLN